jgi:monofunctional glycosyltransferase
MESYVMKGLRIIKRFILMASVIIVAFIAGLITLYTFKPPISTLMAMRWVSGQSVERVSLPLSRISPHMPVAVMMSEDARFCLHYGVDWGALRDVIDQAEEEGPSRGASTLPMQLAKNLFLWHGRSYIRKIMEIPLSLVISTVWSKAHIMESYLNMAEWGDGIFGAEQASRTYFKKSARHLTMYEAALLAAALPNPALRNPAQPSARHRKLAEKIVARMNRDGDSADCF